MKSWQKPTPEVVRRALGLATSETDRIYFFSKLANPHWLPFLIENGYFRSAPNAQNLGDGSMRFPQWPELRYLKNICIEAPDQVVDVLVKLPQTDNLSVYCDIVDIASAIHPEQSIGLASKVAECLEFKFKPSLFSLLKVLPAWADVASFDQLEGVLSRLVGFKPDPDAEQKIQRRKENPNDYFTALEPQPFMHSHEYKEFIEDVLPRLLKTMPSEMTGLLVKTTARMIDFKMHPEQLLDKTFKDDWSEIWCRRLVDNEDSLDRAPELLVKALTLSCEAVCEQRNQEVIHELDQQLSSQRWYVFERVRQHLFGKYPAIANRAAIREYIVGYPYYSEYEYRFEFQQMLRVACVHFGDDLLTKQERERIFELILSGPSESAFKEWMGNHFTPEKFEQRQNYFQRKQLLSFRPVLFEKYAERLHDLDAVADEEISDEDYSPVGKTRGGTVSQISPKPKDELLKLSDADLLDFINNWNYEHRDEGDWLKEINITGLSIAFQVVCSECILRESGRLEVWIHSLDQIKRPVYVKSLILAMQQIIQEKILDHLSDYLGFCTAVLDRPQMNSESSFRGDESDAEPKDWSSSRRAVCDLVATCLSKDAGVPYSHRTEILALLERLCTQPDKAMDQGRSIIVSKEMHPFTDAINYPRGRAIEQLFEFARWGKNHSKTADFAHAWEIIAKRMSADTEMPLTLPEYAMLGRCYARFWDLDQKRAEELKPDIFPQNDLNAWSVAFVNLLAGSHPYSQFFTLFKEDYAFALSSFGVDFPANSDHLNLISEIGDSLFAYYLWGVISEDGPDALLKKYYASTEFEPTYWDKLFHTVGIRLSHTKEALEEGFETRIQSFITWRISVGRKKELSEFAYWLEAKCLDQAWLLEAFSKILDQIAAEEFELMFTFDALARNVETYPKLVLECLEKITRTLSGRYIYITEEPVKNILHTGLSSKDKEISTLAASCRENLLKARYFNFLDVGAEAN